MKNLILIIIFLPSFLFAEQKIIRDYNDTKNNYFYAKHYIGHIGESLYCGVARPIVEGGNEVLDMYYLQAGLPNTLDVIIVIATMLSINMQKEIYIICRYQLEV